MTGTKVAKKYANALFGLAVKAGTEQPVSDELVALGSAVEKDPRFLALLAAPQIPDGDKHQLVRAMLQGASQPIVQNLLLFLIDKGRAEFLLEIIADYGRRLDEKQGIAEATITSALPLSDEEVGKIVARLEEYSGKAVRHKLEVDPEILGGVIVIIGGEIIDHSVRHDLLRLRNELRAIKVYEAA